MEECESGKSAKWMRNFGISIGSKGERVLGGGRLLLGEEGRRGASGAHVPHALHTTTLPTFFYPPPNHNHQFRTVTV